RESGRPDSQGFQIPAAGNPFPGFGPARDVRKRRLGSILRCRPVDGAKRGFPMPKVFPVPESLLALFPRRPRRGGLMSKYLAAVCLASAVMAILPPSAHSLIVHDGKIVAAWPAETDPAPQAGPGPLAKTSAAIQHYPRPTGEVWGLTLLVDFSDQA